MSRKSITIVAVVIAACVLTFVTAKTAHIIGNTEPTSVTVDGGMWDYGANAGRAWSQYSHPTRWHAAVVNNTTSPCVAPGEVARITGAQKLFSQDTFDYVFCPEPAQK